MNHAASPSSWANLDNKSLSLIRRTLCSHSPPTTPLPDLLPALTSSTTVDAHLYVLLSIILRDFVHSWYSQITSEPSFTGELIALVAHCIRALEERARKLDIETLVFDELPALIHAHIAGTTSGPRPRVSNTHTQTSAPQRPAPAPLSLQMRPQPPSSTPSNPTPSPPTPHPTPASSQPASSPACSPPKTSPPTASAPSSPRSSLKLSSPPPSQNSASHGSCMSSYTRCSNHHCRKHPHLRHSPCKPAALPSHSKLRPQRTS